MRSVLIILLLAGCAGPDVDPEPERVAREEPEPERERFDWDEWERERDEQWAKLDAEAAERRRQLEEEMAKNPTPKRRTRRIRRFVWESPAETRGRIWNVPEEESQDALLTAFLRVCIAEADGNPQDCVGIWQVVRNNRRRTCDRGMIRRITECDENGETMLSALRRHQRHVLGYIKARNKRAEWISRMTPDCERPEGYPGSLDHWDSRYQKRCSQVVRDGRYLIKGELPPSRPGARLSWLPSRPITWGGRCESGRGACDDHIACSRGLARIPETGTLNAFWCRPGRGGCSEDIDPICKQYRDAHRDAHRPPETPVASGEPEEQETLGG